MCQVVTCTGKGGDAKILEYGRIFSPSADVSQVVGSHYECECVFRFAFFQGSEGSDCVVGLGHIQLDVVDPYFAAAEVTVDGFYGGVVAFWAGGGADAVFERILRGYDKIYHIKTGLLDHVLYDGEVADM